jgi:hypothetical protein
MSDEPSTRGGQVAATPEGGPIDQGLPLSAPGGGQVRITPEAGPLTPPTLRDHMQGPILGLDDASASTVTSGSARDEATSSGGGRREAEQIAPTRTAQADAELRKWPPYIGKPVSEVRWDDARRYAAPLVSQAEKLTIRAIDLSGRGLSRLARFLEERHVERHAEREDDAGDRH